jgi:hypothetical protein
MNENTNYKLIKLTSGETIVCTTEDSCEDLAEKKTITIVNPVALNHVRIPRGTILVESYIMLPWMSFTENNTFNVSTSQIIVAATIKEELRKNYIDYIISRNDDSSDDDSDDTEFHELSGEESLDEFLAHLEQEMGNHENEDQDTREEFGRSTRGNRILH